MGKNKKDRRKLYQKEDPLERIERIMAEEEEGKPTSPEDQKFLEEENKKLED
jgi:hypothetical protein